MRILFLLAVLAACNTAPEPADPAAPRPVRELGRYTVSQGGRVLGTLVQREIDDPEAPIGYWLIENAAGQWLGYADAQGRFYRYEPFAPQERFLGVFTMDKGLALLYDVAPPLRIEPQADRAAREASAPRRTQR